MSIINNLVGFSSTDDISIYAIRGKVHCYQLTGPKKTVTNIEDRIKHRAKAAGIVIKDGTCKSAGYTVEVGKP